LQASGVNANTLTLAAVSEAAQRAIADALTAISVQRYQGVLEALQILQPLKIDPDTQLAAALWPLFEAELATAETKSKTETAKNSSDPNKIAGHQLQQLIGAELPRGCVDLLQGHAEAKKVWPLYQARQSGSSAEGIRRLLLVLIKDVRVVLILLAEQLVLMRSLSKHDTPERLQIARVTSDVHAPLANRLGVWQLKWELEDLAFRYQQPDTYKRIAKLLDERRSDREGYIKHFTAQLEAAMREAGIAAEVKGRPKHIYSIYKKMQKKNLAFDELFDVRAVRLLVNDLSACYAALGVVHSQFQYIPGEFDDYIANPKGNNYRSLHTAVLGEGGKTVEIQIRTQEMHEHAELGVAAHWRYKEGGNSAADFERKINWMRQLLDAREEANGEEANDHALEAGFSTALLEDHVYVLTPKGEVLELPAHSTVLDFAYLVHTAVGHRCRGAKVNGRIVPLTHQPASGDRVEILTGKDPTPNRNWLDSQAGYLNSPRARGKVRAYFNQLDLAHNLSAGREMLDKELKRLSLSDIALDQLAQHFHLKRVDDLLIQIALGDFTMGQISRAAHEIEAARRPQAKADASLTKLKQGVVKPVKTQAKKLSKDAVLIEGVGNLMVSMGNCCKPLPGDSILGFITRGRGLVVHRSDCKDLKHSQEVEPQRVVEVQWGLADQQRFRVQIQLQAFDRGGLLRDVGTVLAEAKVAVLGSATRTDAKEGTALMDYTLEVGDYGQLSALLAKLRALNNVLDARRI
jgi:GTP pyrophosphokinase